MAKFETTKTWNLPVIDHHKGILEWSLNRLFSPHIVISFLIRPKIKSLTSYLSMGFGRIEWWRPFHRDSKTVTYIFMVFAIASAALMPSTAEETIPPA